MLMGLFKCSKPTSYLGGGHHLVYFTWSWHSQLKITSPSKCPVGRSINVQRFRSRACAAMDQYIQSLAYWCLVGNGWVAGGCWDDDITSDEMDPSRKFPAFSTSKLGGMDIPRYPRIRKVDVNISGLWSGTWFLSPHPATFTRMKFALGSF